MSIAALNPVDWWDANDWDAATTSITGMNGTVIAPNGKSPPTLTTVGSPSRKVLNFGASHALRTPFNSAYRSIFSGDCTLVILAQMMTTGGSRIMVAGRQASWNGLGNGVIDVGRDSSGTPIHYTQMFDGSSNAATIPERVTPVLLAVRKVGLTVQLCALYDGDTEVHSAVSANGPNITDIEYFCIGGGWHSLNQGKDFAWYAGGFFPSALTNADLVTIRDEAMAPRAPNAFSGLVEWWDPTMGVASTGWTGRTSNYVLQKLSAGYPDLSSASLSGLNWVYLNNVGLGMSRVDNTTSVPGVYRTGTLISIRYLVANTGQFFTPLAVGDWGAGLGGASGATGVTHLAMDQGDHASFTGAQAVQQHWDYFGGGSVTDGVQIATSNASVTGAITTEALTRNVTAVKYYRSDNLYSTATVADHSISQGAFRMNASFTYHPSFPGNSGQVYMGHTAAYNRDLEPHEVWQIQTWMRKGLIAVTPVPMDASMFGIGSFTVSDPILLRNITASMAGTSIVNWDAYLGKGLAATLSGTSSFTGVAGTKQQVSGALTGFGAFQANLQVYHTFPSATVPPYEVGAYDRESSTPVLGSIPFEAEYLTRESSFTALGSIPFSVSPVERESSHNALPSASWEFITASIASHKEWSTLSPLEIPPLVYSARESSHGVTGSLTLEVPYFDRESSHNSSVVVTYPWAWVEVPSAHRALTAQLLGVGTFGATSTVSMSLSLDLQGSATVTADMFRLVSFGVDFVGTSNFVAYVAAVSLLTAHMEGSGTMAGNARVRATPVMWTAPSAPKPVLSQAAPKIKLPSEPQQFEVLVKDPSIARWSSHRGWPIGGKRK